MSSFGGGVTMDRDLARGARRAHFLATACEANRGLSHRFSVIYLFIYLFIYLVRKLFLKSLLLRRLWTDLNADFFISIFRVSTLQGVLM